MRVQCPTCLEEFTPEDELQCPPCGHVFHRHCVQEWFDYKRAFGDRPDCPQCRKVTNVNKLIKIYLAEVECDSQEEREKDLHRQIEEIQYKLELKEGENNSLLDKVDDLESLLNEKTEKLDKNQVETERMKKEHKVLGQKLQKLENERGENENLRDKWTKSKRMLEELEEKQGQLKMKLRETENLKNEDEKGRREAEKGRKESEDALCRVCKEWLELHNEKKALEFKLEKLAYENRSLKKELISLEEKQEPTLGMKSREAEIRRKEKKLLGKEIKHIFIQAVALCAMAILNESYLGFLLGLFLLGVLLYDVYDTKFSPE